MSAFEDVVHKIAFAGAQCVEYVEGKGGKQHITLNGIEVAAEDVVKLIQALQELALLLGVAAA